LAVKSPLNCFFRDLFLNEMNFKYPLPLPNIILTFIFFSSCPTPAVAQKLIPNPIKAINSAVKLTYLQAFRFDSSPAIRITCHLELCKENCKSVKKRIF